MSQSVFETALPELAACLGMSSLTPGAAFSAAASGQAHTPLIMQTTVCYGQCLGPEIHQAVQSIADSLKQRSASAGIAQPAGGAPPPATCAAAASLCAAASDMTRAFSDGLSAMCCAFQQPPGAAAASGAAAFGHGKRVVETPSPRTATAAATAAAAAGVEAKLAASVAAALARPAGGLSPFHPDVLSAVPAALKAACSPDLLPPVAAKSEPLKAINCGAVRRDCEKYNPTNLRSFSNGAPGLSIVPPGCNVGGGGPQTCPAHGIKAVCGKRSKMEDMFQVQANFFDLSVSPGSSAEGGGAVGPHESLNRSCPARFLGGVNSSRRYLGGGRSDGGGGKSPSPPGSVPLSPSGGGGTDSGGGTMCPSVECDSSVSDASSDTLHFFGVYDGHGGTQASEHCAKRLHHHLGQALAETCGALASQAVPPYCDIVNSKGGSGRYCQTEWNLSSIDKQPAAFADGAAAAAMEYPKASLLRSRHLADAAAAAVAAAARSGVTLSSEETASCDPSHTAASPQAGMVGDLDLGGDGSSDAVDASSSFGSGGSSTSSSTTGLPASVNALLEEALREAFVRTDAEFAAESSAPMVGSTAVVALVGSRKLWVANCGDSRAVLCRAAKAIQLTDDHKPEREDEAERVERAGGQVLYWNGHRVMGVLAMSRAIGDHALRPYVICDPEITVMTRTEEDDFLLLASDGLWDVMSNQEATSLAIRCMRRAREKGASKKAAVRIAASVLTKAAMDRGSKDNITVVIVDLSGPGGTPTSAAGAPAAADDEEALDGCSLNASSTSVAGKPCCV